jgi:hypothetical protein
MKVLVAVLLGAAALVAPAATGDPGQWYLSGSGVGSGVLAGDHVEVGAQSDVGGANPRGHAEDQGSVGSEAFNDGGPIVCLKVLDHRAVVVWKLRNPLTFPELPGRVYLYGAAYIEDNGNPVGGQPVDRMVDYVVREPNLPFFCDSDVASFFGAGDAEPLVSGNFVVRGG